jgi:diguanylate cyclase (GGDEF)-like protein
MISSGTQLATGRFNALPASVAPLTKRDSDVRARVGGEEFAMLLPERAEEAAAKFAERLRQEVHDCPPTVEADTVKVTVSVGIAGATLHTPGIEALLRRADQALYERTSAPAASVLRQIASILSPFHSDFDRGGRL